MTQVPSSSLVKSPSDYFYSPSINVHRRRLPRILKTFHRMTKRSTEYYDGLHSKSSFKGEGNLDTSIHTSLNGEERRMWRRSPDEDSSMRTVRKRFHPDFDLSESSPLSSSRVTGTSFSGMEGIEEEDRSLRVRHREDPLDSRERMTHTFLPDADPEAAFIPSSRRRSPSSSTSASKSVFVPSFLSPFLPDGIWNNERDRDNIADIINRERQRTGKSVVNPSADAFSADEDNLREILSSPSNKRTGVASSASMTSSYNPFDYGANRTIKPLVSAFWTFLRRYFFKPIFKALAEGESRRTNSPNVGGDRSSESDAASAAAAAAVSVVADLLSAPPSSSSVITSRTSSSFPSSSWGKEEGSEGSRKWR